MTPLWSCAAGALSALWWAGPASADIGVFNNLDSFTELADAKEGYPSQTFRSSDIIAPVFQVNYMNESDVDPAGYIFMGTRYGHDNAGPMILDAKDMSLIYADQKYENTYTCDAHEVNGSRYMIFWEGAHARGHANGFTLVFDENYNLVYNVSAQGLHGALADMHEASFTEDGTIIFSAYWNIPYDCSSVGGPEQALLMDSGFQEVDPATNEVLFHWAASDHFPITDSYADYSGGYGVSETSGFDFAHINSIQKTADGNYLVSSRHLSAVILVDGTDGHPIWVLGGKHSQFIDLSDGKSKFGWQHDAKFLNNQSHITMFDNHGEATGFCDEGQCHTRGLHLEIDTGNMTVRVVQEYYHPELLNSGAMGGFSTLPNGNSIVGWGYNPGFVEYRPDGTPVMDVQRGKLGAGFLSDMFAYRVHKADWVGRPSWPPSVAIEAPHQTTENATVWMSWNGATDVAKWAVFASDDPWTMDGPDYLVKQAYRTGFETELILGGNSTSRYIAVAAVTAEGEILGSSYVVDMATGQPIMMPSRITNIDHIQTQAEAEADSYGGTAGMFGGVAVAFGAVSALVHYCYRRRRARQADPEMARYKRVDTEDDRRM